MAGFFPMFVRLAGRIVVVVGGNETAARTVDALIACDAEVRVISPTFCPQLRRLRGTPNLTLIARSLEHGDLEDALLAIAVDDDPTVNLRAAREGLEWNVLVTVADELALSDFVVPSFVHRGKLTLALHAGTHDAVLGQRIGEDSCAARVERIDNQRAHIGMLHKVPAHHELLLAIELQLQPRGMALAWRVP